MIEEDTLPKILRRNYQKYGNKGIAMRKKHLGVWKKYTWEDCYQAVKYFSLGLISLGLETGDKVAIIGDNDPQWFWSEFAAQAAGGVALGIFTDCTPPEVKYIVDHSESKFVVAKDQEQADKDISDICKKMHDQDIERRSSENEKEKEQTEKP